MNSKDINKAISDVKDGILEVVKEHGLFIAGIALVIYLIKRYK